MSTARTFPADGFAWVRERPSPHALSDLEQRQRARAALANLSRHQVHYERERRLIKAARKVNARRGIPASVHDILPDDLDLTVEAPANDDVMAIDEMPSASERERVLRVLEDGPASHHVVAKALGWKLSLAARLLDALHQDGAIARRTVRVERRTPRRGSAHYVYCLFGDARPPRLPNVHTGDVICHD